MGHKVYILKTDTNIGSMAFKKGQEFVVVNQVVYMNGMPVSAGYNEEIVNWINKNPDQVINDTRK